MENNEQISVPHDKQFRKINELPPHITYQQYIELREDIMYRYNRLPDRYIYEYRRDRDRLLMEFLWETGAMLNEIINFNIGIDLDFFNGKINLFENKREEMRIIHASDYICSRLLEFKDKHDIITPFRVSKPTICDIFNTYSKRLGFKISARILRNSMAIYLISQNVPLPIIAYRMGQDVSQTAKMYIKVDSEDESSFIKKIDFHGGIKNDGRDRLYDIKFGRY